MITFVSGLGFLRPSLHGWRRFGALARFGIAFQVNWILIVLRDQGVNSITGAVGGLRTLGLWSLTRLLQMPWVLLDSASRNPTLPW